jgi:hypothetical protein
MRLYYKTANITDIDENKHLTYHVLFYNLHELRLGLRLKTKNKKKINRTDFALVNSIKSLDMWQFVIPPYFLPRQTKEANKQNKQSQLRKSIFKAYRTFLVRFGGISGEFGRTMIRRYFGET